MTDGQSESVFARLGQNEREALGGERLELIGIKVEGTTVGGRQIGPRQGRLGERRGQECAQEVRGALAQGSLREVANDDRTFVHEASEGDRALWLCQHAAQARHHERLTDLVLYGRNGFGAEAVAVSRVLVHPK